MAPLASSPSAFLQSALANLRPWPAFSLSGARSAERLRNSFLQMVLGQWVYEVRIVVFVLSIRGAIAVQLTLDYPIELVGSLGSLRMFLETHRFGLPCEVRPLPRHYVAQKSDGSAAIRLPSTICHHSRIPDSTKPGCSEFVDKCSRTGARLNGAPQVEQTSPLWIPR